MESSFCELRSKIVVNLSDGRKLGHIIDIIFEQSSAKILGLVVPSSRSFINLFRPKEDIFIPYHNICKIGEDVILVQLTPASASQNVESCSTFFRQQQNPYLTASKQKDS